jgi:hypothetical protein
VDFHELRQGFIPHRVRGNTILMKIIIKWEKAMAILDYQTLMLPLLKLANDEKVISLRNATDKLAKEFNLHRIS